RRDETMDAGLRAQIERVLHLVEGGRHAGFFQPFVDETQKFVLFAREHLEQSPVAVSFDSESLGSGLPVLALETKYERELYVRYVLRHHLTYSEREKVGTRRRSELGQ